MTNDVPYEQIPRAAREALDVTYERVGVEMFWNSSKRPLGGGTPSEFWKTPEGRQDVRDLIERLDGVRVRRGWPAAAETIRELHKPRTVTEGHDCNDFEQFGVECEYKLDDPPHDVIICDICGYEGRNDAHYPCATVAALDELDELDADEGRSA